MKTIFNPIFIFSVLLFVSCKGENVQQSKTSQEAVTRNDEISFGDVCSVELRDEYLAFKKNCKNDYSNRLDIGKCDQAFYSLKSKIKENSSCETNFNENEFPKMLDEKTLLNDKQLYEEQYYHGSEGQFRCGVYTEQEFGQYIKLCPVEDFKNKEEAKKCFEKTKYIKTRYPNLDCDADLGWYGAMFSIFNVNNSYLKAKEYLAQ